MRGQRAEKRFFSTTWMVSVRSAIASQKLVMKLRKSFIINA